MQKTKYKNRSYLPSLFERPFPSPGWTGVKSVCHSQTAVRGDAWSTGGQMCERKGNTTVYMSNRRGTLPVHISSQGGCGRNVEIINFHLCSNIISLFHTTGAKTWTSGAESGLELCNTCAVDVSH